MKQAILCIRHMLCYTNCQLRILPHLKYNHFFIFYFVENIQSSSSSYYQILLFSNEVSNVKSFSKPITTSCSIIQLKINKTQIEITTFITTKQLKNITLKTIASYFHQQQIQREWNQRPHSDSECIPISLLNIHWHATRSKNLKCNESQRSKNDKGTITFFMNFLKLIVLFLKLFQSFSAFIQLPFKTRHRVVQVIVRNGYFYNPLFCFKKFLFNTI